MVILAKQLKYLEGSDMRYILIIVFICFTACNSDKERKLEDGVNSDITTNNGSYPPKIVQLGLEKWYDEIKWAMYCIYCDDTCMFQKNTGVKDSVTFASLDLRFYKVEQFNDTTEINFYFYYDTLRCDLTTVRNLGLASGAGFKKGSDSISFYTSSGTMRRFWNNDPSSRYKNPLQSQVVEYINKNEGKLHPWFHKEAIKRKVIQ